MNKITSLEIFFETEIRHLYQAEKESYDNLLVFADECFSNTLREVFLIHIKETEYQINRLLKIFNLLNINPNSNKILENANMADKGKELINMLLDFNFSNRSLGMGGIIKEGKEIMRHFANTDSNDIALITTSQKVENYELVCYESLCFLAKHHGHIEVLNLLQTSLDEEKNMSEKLRSILNHDIILPLSEKL